MDRQTKIQRLNLHPWDATWMEDGDYIVDAMFLTLEPGRIDVHYPCPKDASVEHQQRYGTHTQTIRFTSDCPRCCDHRTWVHIGGCIPLRAATEATPAP